MEKLSRLLDDGAEIDARDRYGQTSLMLAAHAGQLEVISLLIDRGAELDHQAKYGLTALMLAVVGGHQHAVRMLVEAGANLALRGTGAAAFRERTALEIAREAERPDIVALLDRGLA